MRIFLIGYMGSGKSSLGKGLAHELQLDFIDLDDAIEKKFGRDIPAIFATDGEQHFREMERQVLTEVMERDQVIIATGGGTPCFYDNMEKMNQEGITIYLKMSVDSLTDRLEQDSMGRPMLEGKTGYELHQYIGERLLEREPYYVQAHYKVKAKDLKATDLAEFIRLHEAEVLQASR